MGLVAPLEKFAPLSPARPFSRGTDKWPSYGMCLDKAPRNRAGSGPDRSRADYVWCMIAISWGHGIDETAARLLQESRKGARGRQKLRDADRPPGCSRRRTPASIFSPFRVDFRLHFI